jgi:perosamine synthetase
MIPVCEPLVTPSDIARVNDALASGWISSSGSYLDRFEERWAEQCQMPYGIAVSNGSTALDIAVALLDLKAGDEVILPTFTIISPAQSVVRAGGMPVLVDSDPVTWQMDAGQIESRIGPRTRAIIVVHIYGHPADMDPILALAERYGLTVIEDAAEAHGAEYKGRPCGGLGDISTFSFYANKLVTTGEGGMVLVRNPDQAERARGLRNLCFQPARRFFHESLGYNYRMTNVQAALGVGQLERLPSIVARKREIAGDYRKALEAIPQIQLQPEMPWGRHVYWVFGILLNESIQMDATKIQVQLRAGGVETRPFFLGMHEQPVFHEMGLFRNERHPVAERLARRGFYIPNGLALSPQQVQKVIAEVRKILT